ncbi:hypothetical protein [Geobacillus sp. TFV-3]|uniref:hypothetical protein n=1 Tax=Geobacillus sp. TFV-3 TaxID=1897059 RepID=UPI001356C0E3|nr:hypothetical protein [Geobacillus sp. TFV-3]KAF0993822.1 hypothetical protein BJQ97_00447 [Geobacillus sp. TFV-3]
MAGYKVDELYREVGKYKARIDVYITAQGYEATAVFLDNLNTHISHPNKVKTKDFLFSFLE